MTISVPWNAAWSAEQRFEVRPCRWAEGKPALWSPHRPGEGRPIFAKPHVVRQRRSIAQYLCTVCGEKTPAGDRYWFGLGEFRDEWFLTTEAPVHKRCAEHARTVCPHLSSLGAMMRPMPRPHSILCTAIGGTAVQRDFGVTIPEGKLVVGALKLAWRAVDVAPGIAMLAAKRAAE